MNLDITPEVSVRLKKLAERSNSKTMIQLLRNALAVYEFMVDEIADGAEVVVRKNGKERKMVLPKP